MSFRVRPARGEDFDAIYEMAKLTGGGFTNLPADQRHAGRQARPVATGRSRARATSQADDLFVFVLEDPETGAIRGTCQMFGQVGVDQPFYSYRI